MTNRKKTKMRVSIIRAKTVSAESCTDFSLAYASGLARYEDAVFKRDLIKANMR